MSFDRLNTYIRNVIATLCVAAIALLATPAGAGGTRPTLVLDDLSGTPRSLADERGNIVVLNFWATWCLPCLEELPLLESIAREYEERGVVFVAASSDDASTSARIPAVIDDASVTFPVWTGATTMDMQRFDVGTGVPATVIVDRDGSVAFRVLGPVSGAELRERLNWLTGPRDSIEPDTNVATYIDGDAITHIDGDAITHGDAHDHGHEHDHDHALTSGNASLVPS